MLTDGTCAESAMKQVEQQPLKTSAFIVFALLVAAKLLNFVKKVLIGKFFGVTFIADAFFAAGYLPYYLAIFFEGVIFLAFLPLFSQVKSEKGRESSRQFAGEVFLLVLFMTGVFVALAYRGGPWFVNQLVPGFSPLEQHLTVSLFRILSLVVIFISLCSFFKALNSYFDHQAFAASSGVVDAAVMMGIMFLGWRAWGIYGAAWGAVFGAFVAFGAQAFYFFRAEPFFPLKFFFQSFWLRKLLEILVPLGMIWSLQQIPLLILNRFGSGMWEGTISALNIALTVTTVPMGLVSHTVLVSVFPSMAKQANDALTGNIRQTFFKTLRGSFFILIPLGFLLTAFARPFSVLFFQGGGVSAEGTQRTANALACLGWATFALYADLFMTQSLLAIRRTLPAIGLCGIRALLTYLLTYFLSTQWDYQGLALSFSLALVINWLIFYPLFFRGTPFMGGWGNLYFYALKLAVASTPLFLSRWILNRWSISEWMAFPQTVSLAGLMALGFCTLAFYLLLTSWLKVEEFSELFKKLGYVWFRKDWSPVDPNS